ncbi:pectinesterase family protein [Chengkuizengella axinellae]|uniref:Pectinesterase family protein n=1 Tax=Chengkuizengella axinellae TaxID=3064388 RepID=A0ABT9IZ60_9BACL|nr:pectinesterase family protein [Chengkuizengella sp. 2205SS18-9]MDP5274079.1 pectinesterase family protein [Chengkuizengella sp. 2205SS18-9]
MTVRNVPTAEFPTIQNALDVSQPYDTIRVGEGNFPESLNINVEGLRLIGAGKGKTMISGQNLGVSDGIIINNKLVTIENLTVQHFNGTGIFINSSNENIIHNVQGLNNKIGIDIDGFRNIIFGCDMNENAGEGVVSRRSTNFILLSKMIGNKSNGLLLEGSINFIYCCLAQQNRQNGFQIERSSCYIISSTAIKNGSNGFSNSSESLENIYTLNKSIENQENGFLIMNGIIGNEALLFDNVTKNNVLDGILVVNADVNAKTRIIRNHVLNNKRNGIRIEGNENVIDRNIVRNNEKVGICISGNETAVRSNCIRGNTPDIFVEELVTDCTFADNDCQTSIPGGLCARNDAIFVPGDFDTISEAIENIDTLSGFQINVSKGIFDEQVNIPVTKSRLRIVGSGMCKTVIEGANILDDGITINSRLNSIENLTVQNFGSDGVNILERFNIFEKVQSKNNLGDGFKISEDESFFNQCEAKRNKNNGFNGEDDHTLIRCKANHNIKNGYTFLCNNLFLFNEANHNNLNGFTFNDENNFIGNCALYNNASGFVTTLDDCLWYLNKAIGNALDGIEAIELTHIIWGNICNKNKRNGISLTGAGHRVIKNSCQMNKQNGIQASVSFDPEIETIIDHNCIENNLEAGIIIKDPAADFFGIRSNCLVENNPDIQNNSESTDNIVFDENKCNSSVPDGLCERSIH